MGPSIAWLALTIPLLGLSSWGLARTVRSLIRLTRNATVLSVPLAPAQAVSVPEGGTLDLFLEGKRGSSLAGLDFELADRDGGQVEIRGSVFRTSVSGLARVRVKVRTVHLPGKGIYALKISGLRPGMDPQNRVVFGRPFGGSLTGHVVALVGLGLLILGALAGSILLLLPRR